MKNGYNEHKLKIYAVNANKISRSTTTAPSVRCVSTTRKTMMHLTTMLMINYNVLMAIFQLNPGLSV